LEIEMEDDRTPIPALDPETPAATKPAARAEPERRERFELAHPHFRVFDRQDDAA
jgi:hypothetical protein